MLVSGWSPEERPESMSMTSISSPDDTTTSELLALLASWRRQLIAQRMSPATLETYAAAVKGLDAFLTERGMPQAVAALTREHVEAFITHLLEVRAPATAHNRYRALRSFFGWLVEEGEISTSPMARMKPPRLPETPPRVLRETEIIRLLDVCAKDKRFNGRRDEAIIRVFADTGVRRGELLGLSLDDIDLDEGLLRVTGKGDRTRMVAIGASSVRSLDRYLRARAKRPGAAQETAIWLGRKGPLRESGLAELVRRRGREAGVADHLHPHDFRHAYAHSMLSAGMQETDLMAVAGWKSREMVARYAASTRQERALKAARALSPVDRIEDAGR